jgi:hypothetical protein
MTITKGKARPIATAIEELGLHTYSFLGSFILIFFFEFTKQSESQLAPGWIVAGIISYTVFAFYFGWFFTSILPRHYKRHRMMFYLQRRMTDIAISVSFMIMDLIQKANAGDPNNRDRSDGEMVSICQSVKVYQVFKSHFERNEPYADFYEYFSFLALSINANVEKILMFPDILTQEQIRMLLMIEKDTNSPMTRNIKFSAGTINNEPAPAFIPDAYAYVINGLRKNANALLESIDIPNSVA